MSFAVTSKSEVYRAVAESGATPSPGGTPIFDSSGFEAAPDGVQTQLAASVTADEEGWHDVAGCVTIQTLSVPVGNDIRPHAHLLFVVDGSHPDGPFVETDCCVSGKRTSGVGVDSPTWGASWGGMMFLHAGEVVQIECFPSWNPTQVVGFTDHQARVMYLSICRRATG